MFSRWNISCTTKRTVGAVLFKLAITLFIILCFYLMRNGKCFAVIEKKSMKSPDVDFDAKSPLEEALEKKQRMHTIRQKYNIKNPKDMKMPTMIFEGEDRS